MLEGIRKYKNVVFVALVGAALAVATVNLSPAADHDSDCRKRIHVAEERLQKAIDKHGEHSSQAEQRRRELEDVRRDCRDVH